MERRSFQFLRNAGCRPQYVAAGKKNSKRSYGLLMAALLFLSMNSFAQLGTYAFTGTGACPNQNPNVTAQPANGTFSSFTTVNSTCVSTANAFVSKNWNTSSTIDLTIYDQFTITPSAGYLQTLTSLSFSHLGSAVIATTKWCLRSSIDNYTTDIGSGLVTVLSQTPSTSLPAAQFTNVGAVTFRIYVVNASSGGASWTIDNVSLYGSINPIPANPSNPTSNSPQCANPGVILTANGAPPAGETWYWQTSAAGTSTANSGATYTVNTSGTYYIRSRNNTSLIWSTGAGSATIAITPNVSTPSFSLGGASTRCQGANTVTYTATASNTTGITYSLDAASIAGGNTINASTGAVTYDAAWTGTSTVTASAAGCNGPTTTTHTVTTTATVGTPVFTPGATSVRCQGAGTVTYGATATTTTGITYLLDAASIAGGNTINSSSGAVTYAAGWSGTTIITASAAGCSGPATATHTVTVTPTVGVPVFALGATSARCQGAGTVTYSATATTNTGITYSLDAASLAAGNTIDASTGNVTFDAAFVGTTVITATATGCNGPKTSTHTVTTNAPVAVPAFALGASSVRCEGGTGTYTATAAYSSGIAYSLDAASLAGGNVINASTGVVTFVNGWTTSTTVTATAAGCFGPQTATHDISITPTVGVPVFTMGATSTRCQGAGSVTYDATATTTTGITYSLNAASLSAGNTINASTGEVTYVASYNGTTIVTATAAGCNGPKTATHTVTVTPTVGTPVFTLGATSSRCEAANTVTYTATATNNTSITYSLDAASIAGGNSINPTNGAVTYDAAWFGTSVITTTAAGCNGPSVATHTVTINEPVTAPVFTAGATSTRCQGAGNITYDAAASNATSISYSLDAASASGGNSINATTGAVTFAAGWSGTSTITSSAAGCFGPLTATHVVTVTSTVGVPVFALGATSSRCQGAATVTYSATATTTTGLTYSLDAASVAGGNTIDASTGDVTYDANWYGTTIITASAAGCNGPKTATHTVTVNAPVTAPVFTLGATSVRCQGAGTVTYTATASNTTGITYSLDAASLAGGNAINSSTGAITYVAGWSGTSTVTASAAGCYGPQTSTHTITITPTVGIPVFTLGATSTRCQGAGNVTYDATATTTTGITYGLNAASLSAGNTINASTGDVTYVGSYSGSTIITASAAGCNGPKTATHTVTVTATVGTPVFTLGATSTRCQGAGTVTYTATATTSTGITYSLDAASIAAGNSINSANGAVTYDAAWSGTSVIIATATGCNGPSTANHTVTITATVGVPVFTLGATTTRCQGAGTVTYSATATTTTGITYSLDAASISGGNSINASTGAVTYAAGWSGTSTVTASAAGCNGPKTATHVVTITPTVGVPVFALGATSSRCQAAATVTYSATATTTTGITYSLDAASVAGGNTINASTGDVTYDANWYGTTIITASAAGCNGPKTATHTVTVNAPVTTPVFTLGATSVRCQGAGTVTYTATASNTTGITYSLDAASLAGGNTINSSTGAVTYVAGWSGTSTVTASAAGCYGPQTSTHTITITPTVGIPVFTLGATSTRCQGAGTVTYSASATTTTGITYSLDAASISGGNSINSSNGTITYAAGWSGTTTVTASAAGCNGPKTATHVVTVTATVGTPVFTLGATSTRCRAANSVTYTATATTSTGISYSLDATSLAAGNVINTATGAVTYVVTWTGTSVITATATGCNGPSVSNHTVTTNDYVTTPVFASGSSSSRCQGAGTVTYATSATNTTGITYSLDAASVSGGNTINSSTGVVSYSSGWSGTTIITASAAGCSGPLTATHTATIIATVGTPVFTLGATSSRCQAAGTVTYSATATTSTGMSYSLDATSVAAGNSINTATGAVTFTAAWTGNSVITATATGCNGPSTSTHTVTTNGPVGVPVFADGATSYRCAGNANVDYPATAVNTTGITYTIDAVADAAGVRINPASGKVNYTGTWTGTVTITASAAGCYGPQTATHLATSLGALGTPVFSLGSTSTRCQGAGTVTYTATAAESASISYSLNSAATTAGNTIDAVTGAVAYVAGWTGSTVITATATGCSGNTKTATHTVTITPTVGIPVFSIGATSTRCQGAGTTSYSATATNSTSMSYALDAASLAGGNTINSSTGAVTYVATWSGNSIITATAAGCNGPSTASHTATITATVGTPVFSSGATSTRCQGAGTVTYAATATTTTGITYTLDAASVTGGNTINSSTGAVTYVAGWSGTSTITASAAGCNGPKTALHTVTITPTVGTPVFTLGATSSRCEAAGAVIYTATATNSTGITYSLDAATLAAGNTIDAATGTVTYVDTWYGTSTITASAAGCNGPKTAIHTVTINAPVTAPAFTLGASSTRCQGAGSVTYTATASNTTGITYSLDAASITGGNSINPANGTVTYVAGWSGTSTVTASAAGCYGPQTATHTVTITATVGTPVFTLGATSTRCQGAGTVTYDATATTTTGITYSLDAASISGGNTINSSTGAVAYAAGWTGTSTITANAAGCNGPKTATHTVTITATVGTPVFTLGASSTRCQGAATVTYTATATTTTGITYSLDAASLSGGNTVNSSTGAVTYAAGWSGTSVVTASAAGCNGPKTANHTVTITATVGTPVFSSGATSTRCQGAGTVTYTATATTTTGITYSLDAASSSSGNSINSANGTVTYAAGWSGTSTITASAAGCNGPKTATHTVTITATVGTPVFTLGATSTRCQGAGAIVYTAAATTSTGTTYSLDATSLAAGNTVDASTGTVTYDAAWNGTSTITASAAGCNGPKTATHTVTVTATVGTPVFTLGAVSTRCQGAGSVIYTATATTTTGIAYSLDAATLSAGNTINSSTGAVTYTAAWSGTSTITASAAGCNGPKTAVHTVTVTATVGTPVFTLGANSTRCQGAGTISYDATATTTTAISYSLNAASLSAGNTINPATGDVTYVGGYSGTTIITASAAGCNGPKTATHTVTVTATVGTPVFASGATSMRCQRTGTVTYTATSTTSTGITYALDAASLAAGNSINASTGAVTYDAAWSGTSIITATATGCNGPATASHTVTTTATVGTPAFTLGSTSTRCQGTGAVAYTATATTATGITYTLDGASLAGGDVINASTGTVTFAAGWSGTSIITATAAGCNGPKTATHTVTITPTVGTPVFAMGASSTRCQGGDIVTYAANSSNNIGITYTLDATSDAAGNTIDAATGEVTWDASWSGTTIITASAAGCNGPATATHAITVTPTVGVPVFSMGPISDRCQGAETVSYVATASDATIITYSLDAGSLAGGNTINASTGAVTYAGTWNGTTVITSEAAGCNGPIASVHLVTIVQTVQTPVFALGDTSHRCEGAEVINYTATATGSTAITYSLDAASLAAGNAIDGATGDVTFDPTWTGNTTVTATATGCNGPVNASHVVLTTPTVGTPVFAYGSNSTRCQGAGTKTYHATATNATAIIYALDATSAAAGLTIDSLTGQVTFTSSWIGTISIMATAIGCNSNAVATHTVAVYATIPDVTTPVFVLGGNSIRCQGIETLTYTANSNHAVSMTYFLDSSSIAGGNMIDDTTGAVTYAAGWSGTSIVTASADGCAGPKTADHIVSITPTVGIPVFTAGASSTRCQGATTIAYTATATNASGITYSIDAASIGGGNYIDPNTGELNYDANWYGTTTITASAAGCNGPRTSSHTVTITRTVGVPVFAKGTSSTRCQRAASVSYSATASTSTGITYALDGASLAAGNAINTSTGVVTYVAGWSGTTIITATATGCNGPSSATHTVTVTPTVGVPVFALGSSSTICQGSGTVLFTATASTTTGITYSLDAASLAGGNTINASTGGVTFPPGWTGGSTVTASAAGCNGPKAASHTVTITPSVGTPVFTLGASTTRCQGAGTVTYSATATTSTGITYSLDGASLAAGNTINPSTGAVAYDANWSGTSVITASATGCNGPSVATHTVTITPSVGTPIFSLGATSTICQAPGTVTYTATATTSTSITYSLDAASMSGGNTVNSSTGVVSYAASWNGTSTITASAAGCNGPKTSAHVVTVTPTVGTPVFSLGASSSRCQGASTTSYSATATTSTGMTYSLDATSVGAGNTINTSTGDVTYTAAWTGTSVITASAAGCNGPKTSTHTVTTNAPVTVPVFTLGASSNRCAAASNVVYGATASNTTGIVYSIDAASIAAGLTINSATGRISYPSSFIGTVIITASAAGCYGPQTATHTARSYGNLGTPVFSLGATSTRCQGAGIVTYVATAPQAVSISYSLNSAAVTAGNTINSATGDVTYVAGWTGSTTITAIATGCSGSTTVATHTVTITPTVGTPLFSLGVSSTRCQGAGTVTYTATATNSTSRTYSLDAASLAAGNTINSSTGIVTYVANWLGPTVVTASAAGCNGPSTANHTVNITPTVGVPVFTAGATSTRCQGAGTVTYTATATNSTGITYGLDGASLTAGNTINSSTGAVTFVAGWSGTTTITASAAGCNGPSSGTHLVTVTPTVSAPVFALGASSSRCQGATTINYSATAANSTGITYALDAASLAAGITVNSATGDVTFVAGYVGTSTITATAVGCNGPKSSTHTVTSTPSVTTPVFAAGVTSTVCQGSAPVMRSATATNATGITYTLDAASTSAGNWVRNDGQVTLMASWSGTTIVIATSTGCNGPKTATHTITITPFVGVPVFALGASSTRCQGSGTVTYTATATNSTAITYSLDATSLAAGNSINSSTGDVTFVASWSGTSTVSASATGCNGPTNASHTITVTPTVGTPVFTLGATSTRCQGGNAVTYAATASNSTSITYSLDPASLSVGNTINASTGAVAYMTGWTGTTTITATAAGCNGPSTASHTVTITPSVSLPGFIMGPSSTRCQGAGTVTYTANAANNTGLTYSLDAASIAGGCTILPATGAVTYPATWNGTTTITVSATGCNGPKTATHTVTINSDGTPRFATTTSTRCQGAGTVNYTGSSANNSGVTYSLDAASLVGGNTINPSTGAVGYDAAWIGTTVITSTATGCGGVRTATHTVTITPNGTPTFALGPMSSRLQGAGTTRYSAVSNNGAAVTYSLDAASTSAGLTVNASTGDVTFTAAWVGTTVITASVNGCNGVATATHTVKMNAAVVTAPLYLSDVYALDRIDPVATNDITTSTTANFGVGASYNSITVDNKASSSATASSLTLTNFITGNGANRYMLVSVALDASVTSVTYAGQNLSLISAVGTGRPRVEMWGLSNPPSGTGNIVITASASGTIKAGATTFTGIDQATPYRVPVTTGSGFSIPTITVASAVNDLVYDVVGVDNAPTVNGSAGQTEEWTIRGSGGTMSGGASIKPGAASVTMSWATSTNPNQWSQIGISLRPAPMLINSWTFTQNPVMCSAFIVSGGNTVKVTAYVNVVSGTMPATPAVTATLRNGATNIITLSNSTYNSVAGTLTWTGSLASDAVVPAGGAISLDIATTQPGVTFSVSYDSKTKPSRIELPTSTYVNIQSLAVFNAAYPAGAPTISAVAGSTNFVRATVTSPFGPPDVTSVGLAFSPLGTNATTTVINTSASGCAITFQYPWNSAGLSGSYNIVATAYEGYESSMTNIRNTTFSFCSACPPVAVSDTAVGAGGAPLILNVLDNDYDPNNNLNPSSLTIVRQPANGSALLSGNKIVYLPNGSYTGKDTLDYQICDLTSPTPLCATGRVFISIDPMVVDPCSDAVQSHVYYVPYPETDARTALLASQNTGLAINNLRTIISMKMPYPNMIVVWDNWEDGYETNILAPTQSTTQVWGDNNPYNGIAPGYPNDIIPAGGSIVLDNTMPVNPRVPANIFYDGKDKIYSSGQITMTQVTGEPATIGLQSMKTNISSTVDFGESFTIPVGENFNSQDFKYTALFIRAAENNTIVRIDKDNDNVFELIDTLSEGESILVNGGVKNGATVASTAPVGVDLHFGGVDGYSSREAPIYPATWYSNVYYTPVPTTHSPDSAVVMLYNSLSRPIAVNWASGAPASGIINLPAKTAIRFVLALSATSTYKFWNPTGEAFTAIEIVDSYTPGGGGNDGSTFDWAFNLIAEARLTSYATIAWAPGSTNGTRNDNPIWVTSSANTTIYVKYNGDVLNGGSVSSCGLHYDVSYPLTYLNYKRILDASDKDQSGIAVFTCDGTILAAVYGEDPSTASSANPSWDVGTTIQPFCALKLILANDDMAYTLTDHPVTIKVTQNDNGFQSTINLASVSTTGYMQPTHGTVSVNPDGTVLYTPSPGYIGVDSFEYSVCSNPAPVVCDKALVIVKIDACPTPANMNIIQGMVFLDRNKDGINNDGGVGYAGHKVYLYADDNCNGVANANELKDSVMLDQSGGFQFLTYPQKTVADNFDGPGGTNTCASGSDGTSAWLSNWIDAGDASSVGFCVTPAQSYNNTNAEIVKDVLGGNTYALRLKNANVSATRTVNLSGATAAYLTFSYRRASTGLAAGENVMVQASSNGIAFTTIYTITGDGTMDASNVTIYNQNILPYASATTYIRFLTNGFVANTDTVYIDNINITYLKYPQCYIVRVDTVNVSPDYHFTTIYQYAFTANNGGSCFFPYDYGVAKNSVTITGTVRNDANGLTDNAVNGPGTGKPSNATLYAYLVDSLGKVAFKTTVNSNGTYSFPLADVTTTYKVRISTCDSALYTKAPAAAKLPVDWIMVGDAYGTPNTAGTGVESGSPDMSVTVKTAYANISGVDFGMEQLPVAGSGYYKTLNPNATNFATIPASTFVNTTAGADLSPGIINALRITIFPPNTTTMTINGTIYTRANFPLVGVTVPSTATGQPTQVIKIDPYDNFVKTPIEFYTIDDAGKESVLTGIAMVQFLTDADSDGIADQDDIDDDNDGITDYVEICGSGATSFACLPGGADPMGDVDDDGIVNYKDADFGTLNSAGCVAFLDSDSDGVPDFLDADSDNDGIPDVVEAGGVDANGDGIIDNYLDTDGDGLSQNVDANNTGAAGSGCGLCFVDTDGDGVPNTLDLDSDGDGIPDILEAGGVDGNNDGRYNGFTDANANGLNDAIEGVNALLKTGPDANNDGRADNYPNKNADQTGKPNPYDLDADGDGIADAVEAGFPYWVPISNGMVTGPKTNGWSISVQALSDINLANTDGRGPNDYLDIDSDDDGISDNIEGQPTFSYKLPVPTDTDGDGISDAYDVQVNTYGGAGITPYDHDFDGLPDYIDFDADNDGAADINEASRIFTLNQGNINTADADGDGMLDQFDVFNVNTATAGNRYKNVTNNNMGPNGNWSGPLPSGSNVTLVRSNASGDRDWRSTSVLAVHTLVLSGTLHNNISDLKFKAENEQDADYYTVERSLDGQNFFSLGYVSSLHQASGMYHYNDNVEGIGAGKFYYRIVQVNSSGEKNYSNVVVLENPGAMVKMDVFPIPVDDHFTLAITSPVKQLVVVVIIDVTGKEVIHKQVMIEKGANTFAFNNLDHLAQGTYVVKATIAGNVYVVKFVKE